MNDLVQQLRKVIDTPRGRIPVSVIYLCRNVANELERLNAKLAAAKTKHYEECAVICDGHVFASGFGGAATTIRAALTDTKE